MISKIVENGNTENINFVSYKAIVTKQIAYYQDP